MTRCEDRERGKVRYGTQERAIREAMKRALRLRGLYLAAYRCPRCGGWHLTKQRRRA